MERLKLNIQKFASGTIDNFNVDTYMQGKIDWSSTVMGSTPQEKAQLNKSSVTAILYVRKTNSVTTWGTWTGKITINGQETYNYPYLEVSGGWVEVQRKTIEVSHNNDGSRQIRITGDVYGPEGTTLDGKHTGGSLIVTLDKIPRYATSVQSLKSKTETSITMNWSSDNTIDYVWYSTNNGTNWTAVGGVNNTNGSYTISGLSANTTYNIKTRVRRKDSQLTTDSSASSIATYNWPNCTSAPNFTIGNSVTLQFYNPLNRTFDIRMWSHSASAFVSDSITISGTSYTFTPDASTLYATIPNAKSSVYNIDSTYNTHKIVKTGGSYSVNETTSKPTFNDFTYADTNATTLALTGDSSIVVQNYSNITATISTANKAVANNSATMSKYNLVIGNNSTSVNYSDNESVSATLNNVSSNIINLYAEDSRGLTTLVTKTATLKAYTNIQKGQINITRAGNVGTGVTLTYNGTLWGESFGSVTNTAKSATYRFKKTSDSNWTTGTTTITPTTSGNDYSFTGGIAGDLGNTGFSVEYSFNIEVEVFDELSSVVFSFTLGTGIPHIAVADNGIAIKQPYDTNDDSVLQVNGKTHLKGNTSIGGTISSTGNGSIGGSLTVGSFTRNTTDTWVPVIQNGKLDYTTRVIWNSKQSTGYNTEQDRLVTLAALSYWNGAYNSSNASNLTYAHQGTIQCKPTNLYNNANGTSGNVTLSQTSANFTYLQIFYKNNDGFVNTQLVYSPNGKKMALLSNYISSSNNVFKLKGITISGTSITVNAYGEGNNAGWNYSSNNTYILRVDGWK